MPGGGRPRQPLPRLRRLPYSRAMAEQFDVVVIGAGAVGSAAAYHAAKSGRRTLLLEQFELGHTRGSSHGESRIIRHSYSNVDYATLAPPAFELWRQLERESGADLLTMTGGIDLGPADNPAMLACRAALTEAGFGHIWLEGDAARDYAPQFDLPEDWAVLFQSGAGILNATRSVRTLAAQSVAFGARLVERARVVELAPGARTTQVRFEHEGATHEVDGRAVVVAAGPWATQLFPALGLEAGLKVTHQQVVYYPVTEPALWFRGRAPLYIAHGRDGFYGFPVCERPGFIKVGIELAAEVEDVDVQQPEANAAALAHLNEIVAARFRGVRPEPAEVVTCRYTETPDRDFIIDRHPEHAGVVLASPCSGHGFKFSIVTGKLAVELATTPSATYGSPLWRERFRLGTKATATSLAAEWRG
jgi:monomeric sarcosine oxidase